MDQTATQTGATESIRADISGDISGQVAVGNYILQVGSVHGGVVQINLPDQRPRLRARPKPVAILPRRFSGLLDRVDEVAAAAKALPSAQPVEFHAENGMGKTSLLRVLAHRSLVTSFEDGVIYLSARGKTPEDLLQSIFDALYEYDAPYKPSEGEIRRALQGRRVLVLLDDVDLNREDLESLFDAAPQCAFLLASPDRKIWSEGLSIQLSGLPLQEARELLERELGRKLSDEENPTAEAILSALKGSPLAIIQLAALVREGRYAIKSLADLERDERPDRKIAAFSLRLLTESEQRVVASIAALNGAPLNAQHMPALTGLSQPEPLLDRLQKRGLVQQHETGFSLAGSFALLLQESWDLTKWREVMSAYLSNWAGATLREPHRIAEDAQAFLHLIDWANGSGRWKSALELVKAIESALALGMRWGAWERALKRGLEAAQGLGDLRAKAWILHQLGTRAMCLGDHDTARQTLVQALRIREALGDRGGAATTRHNLDLLLHPPGENHGDSPPDPPANTAGSLYHLLTRTLSVLITLGAIISFSLLALDHPFAMAPEFPLPTPSILVSSPTVGSGAGSVEISESPTHTPSPTLTHTATVQSATPSLTATSTPTELPPPTLVQCAPKQDWPVYFIRPGDTLGSIAQATGSSVPELVQANCLPDTRIFAGQVLYVPKLPFFTATPTPTGTATETGTPTEPPTPTTPAPQFPDLVASLESGPVEWLDSTGAATYFSLPLTATISNQGLGNSGPFQAVFYARGAPAGEEESNTDHFDQLQIFSIEEPVEAGSSRSISTRLEFFALPNWKEIEVWAVADDCTGLPLAGYCQVQESDEQNNQSPSIIVSLPENQPPAVKISNPGDQVTFLSTKPEGERWFAEIVLEGYAQDPEDGLLEDEVLVWTTDRLDLQDERLNTGRVVPVVLYSDRCQPTTHLVTLSATDSRGATGSDSRPITLQGGDCTPRLALEIPYQDIYAPDGYEEEQNRYVLVLTVGAQAYDILGRPISGDRIQWTTDRTDIQDEILGYGENLDLLLYMPDDPDRCDATTHTVQVTATDQEGNQADEKFPITIEEQDCIANQATK